MAIDLSKPETLRKRFHELTARSAKIRKASLPLRDQHDALLRKQADERGKLVARIRKAEDGLFEIEQERAALSRALGGQTG